MDLDDFDFGIFEGKSKGEIFDVLHAIGNIKDAYDISIVLIELKMLDEPYDIFNIITKETSKEIEEEVSRIFLEIIDSKIISTKNNGHSKSGH